MRLDVWQKDEDVKPQRDTDVCQATSTGDVDIDLDVPAPAGS